MKICRLIWSNLNLLNFVILEKLWIFAIKGGISVLTRINFIILLSNLALPRFHHFSSIIYYKYIKKRSMDKKLFHEKKIIWKDMVKFREANRLKFFVNDETKLVIFRKTNVKSKELKICRLIQSNLNLLNFVILKMLWIFAIKDSISVLTRINFIILLSNLALPRFYHFSSIIYYECIKKKKEQKKRSMDKKLFHEKKIIWKGMVKFRKANRLKFFVNDETKLVVFRKTNVKSKELKICRLIWSNLNLLNFVILEKLWIFAIKGDISVLTRINFIILLSNLVLPIFYHFSSIIYYKCIKKKKK